MDIGVYQNRQAFIPPSNFANIYVFLIPADDQENAGWFCPVGEPVNVSNGNMWLMQMDYVLNGFGETIAINRFYNSIIQSDGLFGRGWTTQYDESITAYGDRMIRLKMSDGRAVYLGRPDANSAFNLSPLDFYGNVVQNTDNTYTVAFKDGRVHKFNASGKLMWQKDRNGNQTTLSYDTNGHLTGITDAFNRSLTVTPNADGTIQQISDSIGVVTTYEYFPNTTLLKTVTYADGSKYKFEYDTTTVTGKVFLKTVKDALDNVLETHDYDLQGRATTSEKAGGVEKYTFDYTNANLSSNPYTTVTDALGRVTKYYFDKSNARNVITKIEGNCGCGAGAETTTFEYDEKLNLTKKTDALNRVTTYTYDANGNRLSMTDFLGTESYTYNSLGQVLTRTDRMNGVWTNTYDTSGNLLTATDALNNTTTLTYTTLGQIKTIKDARNNTTTLTYDASGRLTEIKDADNKTTNYGYDARARLTDITNALSQTTDFEYDSANRLKKITFPDTKFVTYNYDSAGRRTSVVDARNKTYGFAYDAAYRLTSVTDPLSHTTAFGYDLMSNPTSVTDALSNTTDYEYDNFDRLKKIKYPAAATGVTRLEENFEYDSVGNLKKRIDTAQRQTLYDYDNANRLIKTTDANLEETLFEYNARSQMTKVTDALNQEYVFAYDALGRQLSQTRAGSTMSYVYDAVGNRTGRTDYLGRTTGYEYDALNRLHKIEYGAAGIDGETVYNYDALSRLASATNYAGTISLTYDNRGRVQTTTDVFGRVLSNVYDANGNRELLKLDGVNYAAYVYDDANRLTSITNSADNAQIAFGYDNSNKLASRTYPNGVQTTYEYDEMSRLKQLKDALGTTTLFDRQYEYNDANQISKITEPSQIRIFGYDNVNRLTSVWEGLTQTESYAYDAVGNRTSSHLSASYSYQPFNQLTASANTNYSFDANGNLIGKTGTWTYGRDYENRLIDAARTQGTRLRDYVSYTYDALGRRVERSSLSSPISQQYTYDGADVLLDESGSTTTEYLNAPGIDNKLRLTANNQTSYFLSDHLGSTTALADSAGTITDEAEYDSFGNLKGSGFSSRYQFTGREFDSTTGLYYYRARWYSSQLGRFISEDPIGFAGGDVNLYGYVRNNPVNSIDPLGLHEPRGYDDPRPLRSYSPDVPPNVDNGFFYGDGGLMRREVFDEFFSAKNRAREKCKPFGERVLQNFGETNAAIPGFGAPPVLGFLTGGAAAETAGVPSLLTWTNNWFGSTSGVASGQIARGLLVSTAGNVIAVNASYEGGVFVGSVISAAGCPCGYYENSK